MSILVQYNDRHTSISEFMYYIAERYEKKNTLTNWECLNLYQVYVDFCEMKNLNYVSRIAFARLVREYGFYSDAIWDKTQRKSVRVFRVDEEKLFTHMGMFSKRIDITKHISYVFIGGKKYRLEMNFQVVDEVSIPDGSNTIVNNPPTDPTVEME